MDAVGIWTYSSGTGIYSDNPIDIENFTVSNQWRKHFLYTQPLQNSAWGALYHRYRTCALSGSCSWTSATQVDYGLKGASAVVYDRYLWVFYKYDIHDYVRCKQLRNDGVWQSCPDFTNNTYLTDKGTQGGADTPVFDSPGTIVGVSAEIYRNRLHLSIRKSNNKYEYLSYCPYGVGCTYRPGYWTNNYPQDDSAYGFTTLKKDSDGILYLFFGAWESSPASPVYYLSKRSE